MLIFDKYVVIEMTSNYKYCEYCLLNSIQMTYDTIKRQLIRRELKLLVWLNRMQRQLK